MPTVTGTFTGDIAVRRRRFLHLAVLRLLLGLGYLGVQFFVHPGDFFSARLLLGGVFAAYGLTILIYREQAQARRLALWIQIVDLLLTVLLVLSSDIGDGTLPLLLFYFLLTESALLHGAREVLLVTCVSLMFYTAWIASGAARTFEFSYGSFTFLLIVGGALAFYFSTQKHRAESRIAEILYEASSGSEADMVAVAEQALAELAAWQHCSQAILAFWDDGLDYIAIAQYPPPHRADKPRPDRFRTGREWTTLRGERLDFYTNDVSLVDPEGRPAARFYDIHPYVIQKFEVYNALGCGLVWGGKPIGRLLLINSVTNLGRSDHRKLQETAPYFSHLVRRLLVVKQSEQEAYERERGHIAQDLHDGPLQSMISFEMRLEIIQRLMEQDADSAKKDVQALQQFSRDLVREMRSFVHRTKPLESDGSSLSASARRVVDSFQRESGVSVTAVGGENGDLTIPGKLGGEILQIVREGLHNVYKHAAATHVLFALERKGSDLHVSIDDNGKGYPFCGKYTLEELDRMRIGPRSIKQRIRALGGALSLESKPGQGSNLRVRIPLY